MLHLVTSKEAELPPEKPQEQACGRIYSVDSDRSAPKQKEKSTVHDPHVMQKKIFLIVKVTQRQKW